MDWGRRPASGAASLAAAAIAFALVALIALLLTDALPRAVDAVVASPDRTEGLQGLAVLPVVLLVLLPLLGIAGVVAVIVCLATAALVPIAVAKQAPRSSGLALCVALLAVALAVLLDHGGTRTWVLVLSSLEVVLLFLARVLAGREAAGLPAGDETDVH